MVCKVIFFALLAMAMGVADAHRRPHHRHPAPKCMTQSIPGFVTMMRSGDGTPMPIGTLYDENLEPITKDGKPVISNNPDFTSLLKVDDELFVVTQFEAPIPSPMYIVSVQQNPYTGELTPKETFPVDLSRWGGAWITCAGSISPWNTHLGAEEYEPDARYYEEAKCLYSSTCGASSWESLDVDSFGDSMAFIRYYGIEATNNTSIEDVRAVFNPYMYGHTIEVAPKRGTQYKVKKWLTMGRIAKELSYVMPDRRTVYSTDDGERVGFFKIVMDKKNDMSAGTIYAAKLSQKDALNGGSFDITWIKMGYAKQRSLEIMARNLKFSKIFETATPNATTGSCPDGFKSINAGPKGLQCLQLKAGMENAAAFFETRRYAAYLGATTEGSKWEGFTYSAKRNTAYTAISDVRRAMEDNADRGVASTKYDVGGPNSIKLPYNPCGCVYSMTVVRNNIVGMKGLVCGKPIAKDANGNTCDLDGIASPDNVAIIDEYDQLIIGEDTSGHQNDVMWSYSFKTKALTRVFSSPYGAETTSPYWVPNINGFNYLMGAVQHPYGESDQAQGNIAANPFFEGLEGYLGYFPFKANPKAVSLNLVGIPAASTQEEKSTVVSSTQVKVCVA